MALTAAQIEQQKQQAEELLFSGPQSLGFAKGLFFGHFNAALLFPYPALRPDERQATEQALAEVRRASVPSRSTPPPSTATPPSRPR